MTLTRYSYTTDVQRLWHNRPPKLSNLAK